MYNIKTYLKSIGITQKEFAEKIGLSRPTLDTYIEIYESGGQIPKERYEIIFKKLFDGYGLSEAVFKRKLEQIEQLLNRDTMYGINDLEPLAADYISHIIRNMKKDFEQPEWNKDVYKFVNYVISNYRKSNIIEQLAKYFLYFNDICEVDNIEDKQKPYLANLYRTFEEMSDNPNSYNPKDFEDFYARCIERKKKWKKEIEERNKKIKESIVLMVKEYKDMGVDLSEQEMIEEMSRRIVGVNEISH